MGGSRGMKKHKFLVVYDYGQGGVWAFLNARSRQQVESDFPELRIVAERPDWMSETELKRVEMRMNFDADHPSGWLKTLIERRGEAAPPNVADGR